MTVVKEAVVTFELVVNLKVAVEEQVEKVKANDQATLLKEVREVKETITSFAASQSKRSSYFERSKELERKASEKKVEVTPVKSNPVVVSETKKEKEEEPGLATKIKDGIVEYAYASVSLQNIQEGFEKQVLVRMLPKTMKVIQERRALENGSNSSRSASNSSATKYH